MTEMSLPECGESWESGQDRVSGLSSVTFTRCGVAGGSSLPRRFRRQDRDRVSCLSRIYVEDGDSEDGDTGHGLRPLAARSFVAFLGIFILIFFGRRSKRMSGTSYLSESAMIVYGCTEGLNTLELWRSV